MRYRLRFTHEREPLLRGVTEPRTTYSYTDWIPVGESNLIPVPKFGHPVHIEIEDADRPADKPVEIGDRPVWCREATSVGTTFFECSRTRHPSYHKHVWQSPDGKHMLTWKDDT